MNNIISLADWKAAKVAATSQTTATTSTATITVASVQYSAGATLATADDAEAETVKADSVWRKQWEASLAAAKTATKMSAMGVMKLGRKLR